MSDPVADIVRASYTAFASRDRAGHEKLLADSFRFTSPYDNGIDRRTFYERCWPNGDAFSRFDIVLTAVSGNQVFICYEAETLAGKRFRNTELVTVENGLITAVEVYFGWHIPHDARAGGFVNP